MSGYSVDFFRQSGYYGYMSKDLPKPFESPLWKHIKQIDALVDSGKSWKEVAQMMFDEHEIKITKQGCCSFYQRFHRREKFPWRVARILKPERKFLSRDLKQPELSILPPCND